MQVWRIQKRRWVRSAFNGEGASRSGGRWNHKGDPVVYTSASLSLAALELLVHLEPGDLPEDLVSLEARLPDDVRVEWIRPERLPGNWRNYPAPAVLQEIGSEWIRSGRSLVLAAPSAIIPFEHNVLIQPRHPEFSRIRIGKPQPFRLDSRLWRR